MLNSINVNNQTIVTVDDELNLSNNLIQNKAIGKFFFSTKSEPIILDNQQLKDNGIVDKYINAEGNIETYNLQNVLYITDYIYFDAKEYEKIYVCMKDLAYLGAIYDKNKNLQRVLFGNNTHEPIEFEIINNDNNYFRFNFTIPRINEDQIILYPKNEQKTLDTQKLKDDGQKNKYINEDGSETNFPEVNVLYITDWIYIEDAVKLHIIMKDQTYIGALYDENKNVIEVIQHINTKEQIEFDIENQNYYYARFNFTFSRINEDTITLFYAPKQVTEPTPMPGITITTSQITDYNPGGTIIGSHSIHYVISQDLYTLGDSVTYGYTATNFYGYSQRLKDKITFKSYNNYAVSGATAMNLERGHLIDQVNRIPQNATGITTVMISTNDICLEYTFGSLESTKSMTYAELNPATDFCQAYRYCMESLITRCPQMKVFAITNPTPRISYKSNAEVYINAIIEICNWLGIEVIDARKECGMSTQLDTNSSVFFADAAHPNNAGHELIANCVAARLIPYADKITFSN